MAGRLSDYFTFYMGAALKLFTLPRHHIVMALTTPPLIGLLALAACRARRMRFVALVQDVYPDVGVALGTFKKGSLLTRMLDALNRLVLRHADRVIVLGECMREVVESKLSDGAARSRVDVIHNWADGEKIGPLGSDEANPFVTEQDLSERFVVLFSGNFGRVNDFLTPLEAARLLKERTDIAFVLVGDGAKGFEIREFIARHELANVRVMPYQPRENLRYSLAAGDAHLVTLAEGLAGLSVPSKTYGILAAGRPILFVGDTRSDAARLVAGNGCGEVVATGDAARLAETIALWADDPARVEQMGRAARNLFERRFDRLQAVRAYVESFEKCMSGAPHPGTREDEGGGVAAA